MPVTNSVRTAQGSTAVTVTPVPANSSRSDALNPTTPNLLAQYAARPAAGTVPRYDAILITWPLPRSSMPGNANLVPISTPRRLMSTVASTTASSWSTNRPVGMMPALFTSTCRGASMESRKLAKELRERTSNSKP